jgi:hypothetical protein
VIIISTKNVSRKPDKSVLKKIDSLRSFFIKRNKENKNKKNSELSSVSKDNLTNTQVTNISLTSQIREAQRKARLGQNYGYDNIDVPVYDYSTLLEVRAEETDSKAVTTVDIDDELSR